MFMVSRRRIAALAAVAVGAWVLSACSPGDLGTSGNGGEAVTLSFLVDNSDPTVKTAQGSGGRVQREEPPTSRSAWRRGRRVPMATTS
jgi:hypothetical protein